MSGARCPACGHVPAIHNRNGDCPRWAGVRGLAGSQGTRVIFRIGRKKWPECEEHILAYFADSLADEALFVWDLTAGTQFTAPRLTIDQDTGYTYRPSREQMRDAAEDLALEIGDRVHILGQMYPRKA